MTRHEHEVEGLVGEIWSTMLGLAVCLDTRAAALADRDDAIVSRVWITGAWRGAVTLYCDPRLARNAAAVMFGVPPEAASVDLMDDALGELANMTSGLLKSLLPGPCRLSLPRAVRRDEKANGESNALETGRFGFNCLGSPFLVTVTNDGASSPYA